MAQVARLVGMEVREYKKDGKDKVFCELSLLYPEGMFDDVIGQKAEIVTCPRQVRYDTLEIDKLYELDYEIYKFKGETRARLQNLIPVEE